jgi:hypothetical protein
MPEKVRQEMKAMRRDCQARSFVIPRSKADRLARILSGGRFALWQIPLRLPYTLIRVAEGQCGPRQPGGAPSPPEG